MRKLRHLPVLVPALHSGLSLLYDGWGDHQYFVFNPDTGALLHFVPEAALRGSRHPYASKRAQLQDVAAGTGVAGGYLEKGLVEKSIV